MKANSKASYDGSDPKFPWKVEFGNDTIRSDMPLTEEQKKMDPRELEREADEVKAWELAHTFKEDFDGIYEGVVANHANKIKKSRYQFTALGFGLGILASIASCVAFNQSHSKQVEQKSAIATPCPTPVVQIPKKGDYVAHWENGQLKEEAYREQVCPKDNALEANFYRAPGKERGNISLRCYVRPASTPTAQSTMGVTAVPSQSLEVITNTPTPTVTMTATGVPTSEPTPNETETYGSLQKTIDAMGYPNETQPQVYATSTPTVGVTAEPAKPYTIEETGDKITIKVYHKGKLEAK